MRRIKKKHKRPKRPWDSVQIKEERMLSSEYGLRRKREIWSAQARLRSLRKRARDLIALEDKEKERALLDKLAKYGLLGENAGLDDVLALTVRNILDRRLQTVVLKRGLAKTIRDSRQLIVHGNVRTGDRLIRFPSYMVSLEEEKSITPRDSTSQRMRD